MGIKHIGQFFLGTVFILFSCSIIAQEGIDEKYNTIEQLISSVEDDGMREWLRYRWVDDRNHFNPWVTEDKTKQTFNYLERKYNGLVAWEGKALEVVEEYGIAVKQENHDQEIDFNDYTPEQYVKINQQIYLLKALLGKDVRIFNGNRVIKKVPNEARYLVHDNVEIRPLLWNPKINTFICTIPVGAVMKPNKLTVSIESWYCLEGEGEVWRKHEKEHVIVKISQDTNFMVESEVSYQVRNTGKVPLKFVLSGAPGWTGDAESRDVDGMWEPTKYQTSSLKVN